MKVIILNGSPNREKGNTGLILKPFIEGIESTGAQLEIINTYDLNINPCLGCVKCLVNEEASCAQIDDMRELLLKICNAEINVFATPLYVHGLTASLKNVLDRLYPIFWPHLTLNNNRYTHPIKPIVKKGIISLVSTCGNWEKESFDIVQSHIKEVCVSTYQKYGGAVLRSHAPILNYMKKVEIDVSDIFEAIKNAGQELVLNGSISKKTEKIISRELLPRDEYVKRVNRYYDEVLKLKNNENRNKKK